MRAYLDTIILKRPTIWLLGGAAIAAVAAAGIEAEK
jgi:hypothetical protein